MARLPLSAFIKDPKNNKGPYSFTLTAYNACSPVTFLYGIQRGISEITISSENPAVRLELEFDESRCSAAEAIANVVVEASNGECLAQFTKDYPNPCQDLRASICPSPPNDYIQKFMGQVTGGNGPFEYEWEVKRDGVFIEEGVNNQQVTINRKSYSGDFKLCLTVTDVNGCQSVKLITVPAIQTECPEVKDVKFERKCTEGKNTPRIVDVIALANDPDGTIDLGSIEIVTAPVCGDVAINYAGGYISYVPGASCTGTQTMEFRVRDNNGNQSNIATATFVEDPCIEAPNAVGDAVTIDCLETVRVNLLANDTSDADIDPNSLEILGHPLNGTYALFSEGDIEYTPNAGMEVGDVDIIRYRFQDVKKNASEIGTLVITIGTCCDNFDVALSFNCFPNGSDIEITATAENTIPGSTSDTIFVDPAANGQYTPGNTLTIPEGCYTALTIWTDDNYTNGLGEITGTTNATVTAEKFTTAGLTAYHIEYAWPTNTADAVSTSIIDFLEACEDVIQIGSSNVGSFPFRYEKLKVANLEPTVNGFKFDYLAKDFNTECEATYDTLTQDTEDLLGTLENDGDSTTWNLQVDPIILRCIDVEVMVNARFRRLITRNDGCDDVELEYFVTMNTNTGCASFTVDQISGPTPGGDGIVDDSFTLMAEGSAITTINEVVLDGQNILDRVYDLETETAELEQYLDQYGDVEVIFDNAVENVLIINVTNTIHTWNYVITNGITTNFLKAS